MKNRPYAASDSQAQNADIAYSFWNFSMCSATSISAIRSLLIAAAILVAAGIHFGAAEARDRDGRERAIEDARRNAEREQERERDRERERQRDQDAARRTADTQSEQRSGEPPKNTTSAPSGDSRKVKSSGDDDDKKEATTSQSGGKSRVEAKPSVDDRPPATVQEMFRRWSKAMSPKEDTSGNDIKRRDDVETNGKQAPAGDSSAESKSAAGDKSARNRKSEPQRPARPIAGAVQMPADIVADFKRVEVLALSSNSQAVAKAKAMGFAASPATRFQRLDLAVTKLTAPDGMSASQAEALLSSFGIGDFTFNRRYRIYRAATGGKTVAALEAERPRPAIAMPTPCGTDRCYGAELVGWRPEFSRCAAHVRIGVIDTAVDLTHGAFKQRRVEVRSFGRAVAGKSPEWHGTGVLALLAGDPISETPGLVHDARFLVANAFYTDDDGLPSTDTLSLLAALDWLDRQKADIVNMSLAGPPDDLLRDALARLSGKGMIFIAAAGNEGPTAPPTYPAAYPSVIAVTAVGRDLRNYRHANRGEHIDLAAPGVQIWTALPGAKSAYHSGTSFAAPFATAAIATVMPPPGQRSKSAVLQRLEFKDLGEAGRDPIYGMGLLVAPSNCSGQAIAAASGVSAPGAAAGSRRTTPATVVQPPAAVEKLPWR